MAARFEGGKLRILKIGATSTLAAVLVATTVSAADAARWDRRGPPVRGVFGAVGALVAGAAVVATLPFAIAASAARAATAPPVYYPNTGPAYYPAPAYAAPRAYYAPPPPASTWYAAPPDVYGQSAAPGYYYPPPPYNYTPGY